MTLIDRQLIRAYLKAYLICLVSLLSLYIVVDMFSNIEDFFHGHKGLLKFLKQVGTYYGTQVFQIFDRLSEAITLLAAMFTVAWMQRSNEILPLLSAGVRIQRVVRPVIIGGCAMLGLTVANQELMLPRLAPLLGSSKEDPNAGSAIILPWGYEPNGIHVEGLLGYRSEMLVKNFRVTIPPTLVSNLSHFDAQEARYIPPGDGPLTGGWLLTNTVPVDIDRAEAERLREFLTPIDPGKYFLRVQEADFQRITRGRKWYVAAGTYQLFQELRNPDSKNLTTMAVVFHLRLTRPLLGILLVFLGLSMILRDQTRNVFISVGMCLGMCGAVFATITCCRFLGDHEIIPPILAAWVPVFVYGPITFVLFDSAHT